MYYFHDYFHNDYVVNRCCTGAYNNKADAMTRRLFRMVTFFARIHDEKAPARDEPMPLFGGI